MEFQEQTDSKQAGRQTEKGNPAKRMDCITVMNAQAAEKEREREKGRQKRKCNSIAVAFHNSNM